MTTEKALAVQQNLRLNGAPRTYANGTVAQKPTYQISTQKAEAGLPD